ncbi:hypothetical protein HS088_TW10G00582 [Tripterygium wilfordii]|uniref:Uncharacterized protein n=1 Tax=Tripterygium wilfordii TaxID=458696 RepID=A0A7J7D5J8_TRIWF|nr:hypothetical protein HS088_TW10G00582 [Tripterygium wilfordii]
MCMESHTMLRFVNRSMMKEASSTVCEDKICFLDGQMSEAVKFVLGNSLAKTSLGGVFWRSA